MEKNLAENSGKAEDMNTGDNTTNSPAAPEPEDNKLDAKTDGEGEKAADSDHAEGDQDPKEEEKKEEEEEETAEAPPDSPPPNLEKVSEDIDKLLATQQHNADANKKEVTTFDTPNFIPIFLQLVEEKIVKYETNEVKLGENGEKDSSFLECMNCISKLMKHFTE